MISYWLLGIFRQIKADFLALIPMFTSRTAIIIYCSLAFLVYSLTVSFLVIKLKNKWEDKKRKAEEFEKKKQEFAKILKIEVNFLNLQQALELAQNLDKFNEKDFPGVTDKRTKVESRIEGARARERIWVLERKENELKESIEEKKHELEQRIRSMEEETQKILERLDAFNTIVYEREELNLKEIKALKTIDFTEKNEFCVLQQKRINVLIKPPEKHSVQHAFLVWSVQRLLEKNRKIYKISLKDSVEADITFEFEGKTFAVEIEKGSLLRKPDQLKRKLGALNRKFLDRWIFLVSNKELYPKYKKFGLTATRANFPKKLEKLLKSS